MDATPEGRVQDADRLHPDEQSNNWFRISTANHEGMRWIGKCWYVHNLLEYEFDLQFYIPVTYPATTSELELPHLDGKMQKMYGGGKICLTVNFNPLWAKNGPRFGITHALCLGLAPWLAAEVTVLVDFGMIKHKDDAQLHPTLVSHLIEMEGIIFLTLQILRLVASKMVISINLGTELIYQGLHNLVDKYLNMLKFLPPLVQSC